jgi:hypothetical protein
MLAPTVTHDNPHTLHILAIKFFMSSWNLGVATWEWLHAGAFNHLLRTIMATSTSNQATRAMLVPKLWMMITYEAHDFAFFKLAPSNLMDPHDAQGSKDISNSNDDPAQGSNNVGTSWHGAAAYTGLFVPFSIF